MKTALVIGGAVCVYEDIERALALFTPTYIIAVKDIGMTYPRVEHWVSYHMERMTRELDIRRRNNLPDPECLWSPKNSNVPKNLGVPVRKLDVRGGSTGFMGMQVGLEISDRVVLAGIPMDPQMTHFYKRKHGKPWHEGRAYQLHWTQHLHLIKDRVRSMSGWTLKLLGEPTQEWLTTEIADVVHVDPIKQATPYSSKAIKRAQARALHPQQD